MPTGLFTTQGRKFFEGDVHLSPKHTAHLSCGHGLPPIPRSGEFFLFSYQFLLIREWSGGFLRYPVYLFSGFAFSNILSPLARHFLFFSFLSFYRFVTQIHLIVSREGTKDRFLTFRSYCFFAFIVLSLLCLLACEVLYIVVAVVR
jgi:hypothetical protein